MRPQYTPKQHVLDSTSLASLHLNASFYICKYRRNWCYESRDVRRDLSGTEIALFLTSIICRDVVTTRQKRILLQNKSACNFQA